MNWQYFVLGVIAYQILKMLALTINREVIERRQRKFIKLVDIVDPYHGTVTFITIDTSDRRAMIKLERQLREKYDLPESPQPEIPDPGTIFP